ncbi:MAG: hypothetical protein ACI4GW_04750 [Lachnospiraceae bacterium]
MEKAGVYVRFFCGGTSWIWLRLSVAEYEYQKHSKRILSIDDTVIDWNSCIKLGNHTRRDIVLFYKLQLTPYLTIT